MSFSAFSRIALAALTAALLISQFVSAAPYNETLAPWNINVNRDATNVLEYDSERPAANRRYTESPKNWRALPTYSLMLDKFADGDPSNNDFFETIFEWDWRENTLRHGGDVVGLGKRIDYLVSLGIRAVYIIGTPFVTMPWAADGYSALDFTLFDPHFGTVQEWRNTIDALHAAGIYVILDFTVGTMGDLIGWKGRLNSSADFSLTEYDAVWKRPDYAPWGITEYPDFKFNNDHNASCVLPKFWDESGKVVERLEVDLNGRVEVYKDGDGCKASEFDQYGDVEAFGVHPDWKRQLSKFQSVQDRLREWQPDVNDKLQVFSCLTIKALDIDGIRIDKATQVTPDALARWSRATRECARKYDKDNFYIPGEVTGGDTLSSIYIGRGRTPDILPENFTAAVALKPSDSEFFMRDEGVAALDGVAFHYSIYRALTRFLGMDGNLAVGYDVSSDFVNAWNEVMRSNDLLNALDGSFDPRHMLGTCNHDIFRWPSLVDGTQRQLVGTFIMTILIPGVPLYYWGEEQAMYLYDSGAPNYLYGRQPMTSSQAWQRHGCYKLGSTQYHDMPLDKALDGCNDDWNSIDHFDPTAPTYRVWKHMARLRETYPVLTDGFRLEKSGNWTRLEILPNGTESEFGLWLAVRGALESQTLAGDHDDWDVYMFYSNENSAKSYEFDCEGSEEIFGTRLPIEQGTTIRNLFYPFDTIELAPSNIDWDDTSRGCVQKLEMPAYGFKAYVIEDSWEPPLPALTRFSPGHDARVLSTGATATSFDIAFEFDTEMDCDSVTEGLKIAVTSLGYSGAPKHSTPKCESISDDSPSELVGARPSAWRWSATVEDAPDGIYVFKLDKASTESSGGVESPVYHLFVRKGGENDTLIFPQNDYHKDMFTKDGDKYFITHISPGADHFRYTLDYGRHWSRWSHYEAKTEIPDSAWDDTADRFWSGEHVIVQYYSDALATSATVVHADSEYDGGERRVPRYIARGPFNNWGFDQGVAATLGQKSKDGQWNFEIMYSWPARVQLNVFDYDDYFYGDGNNDSILERNPPNSLAINFVNMSAPPHPHLGWSFIVEDKTGRVRFEPRGKSLFAGIVAVLLLVIPLLTAFASAVAFRQTYYGIKVNLWGFKTRKGYFPIVDSFRKKNKDDEKRMSLGAGLVAAGAMATLTDTAKPVQPTKAGEDLVGWPENIFKRRRVLIATLEYEIIDWKLKVKIGGLGVMASLMGKAMHDCDLIWVVPKVKDLEYPPGEPREQIEVTIFDKPYLVEVEEHQLGNITYVILDSPVFRAQTKTDPYPERMDDLESAIFYSTWNQAIAETYKRYPIIDIYHINDYHGALAPLYLLPKVVPVCLSLHNAEFQGLWPLRTKDEMKETCGVFNISEEVCSKYVQFGNTFNLLHAAASFISVHQKSVGVAGVSDKYGKRSWARYPALWTLRTIDSLPNPDPADVEALDQEPIALKEIGIDREAEAKRPADKRQAQEWAGLKQDPKANLFVFVGRWSKQKGVDLIADVMPAVLEKNPSIQLICVGPVIDLYGRFAAEKLARLMEMHPDRVFSKPEFTALPPFLFSGADFALIPSRDEPFGLVAVEFGRKGALGVGSRLGGLGLMPGWWFPVESDSTQHMLSQLTKTIKLALKSSEKERAILRARSAVQRFPVMEWRQRLEDFHRRSITTSRVIAGSDTFKGGDYSSASALPQAARNRTSSLIGASPPVLGSTPPAQYDPPFAAATPPRSSPLAHAAEEQPLFSAYDETDFAPAGHTPPSAAQPPENEFSNFHARANRHLAGSASTARDPFMSREGLLSDFAPPQRPYSHYSFASSVESIATIMEEKADTSPLNKAIESFTDADGEVSRSFVEQLQKLTPFNSEHELCIEKYLVKSEKAFFAKMRKEKASGARPSPRSSIDASRQSGYSSWSVGQDSNPSSRRGSQIYLDPFSNPPAMSSRASFEHSRRDSSVSLNAPYPPGSAFAASAAFSHPGTPKNEDARRFLPREYDDDLEYHSRSDAVRPSSLQRFMGRQIVGWPLYCIVMSLGQMLGATSFQLTLLSGTNTPSNRDLYIVGAIFFVASLGWYAVFRYRPSVWALSTPWLFYAIAFFLIGFPSFGSVFLGVRQWLGSAGTWAYAIASAAGFLFFGLNFGEEAGAEAKVWIIRACIVQGSQQVWVAALWYWGYSLNGADPERDTPPVWVLCVVWPLAALSLACGFLTFKGLPNYYRQLPPYVPNFWPTLFRRKLVIWFLVSEVLRNYWLSAQYGRSWGFLWNHTAIPKWATVILIAFFFIGVWALLLGVITYYSKVHSWLLPIFAIGLVAPRWCQELWGASGIGLYSPWGGAAGPYLSISLWLWLGVLDAIQGVGLGMMLLQTLSRLHVCVTLLLAQLIGSATVMIARASSPNRVSPSSTFPNFGLWEPGDRLTASPLAHPAFWICLACQIAIVVGYAAFFRMEQLSKP